MEREGGRSLQSVEQEFDLFRRSVVRAGKEAATLASKATSKREAEELMKQGLADVQEAFEDEEEAVLRLIDAAQRLRRLPRPVSDEPVLTWDSTQLT